MRLLFLISCLLMVSIIMAQNPVGLSQNGRTPVQRRFDAGSAGERGAAGDGY